MRRTLKEIAAEYGAVAVVVYLAIFTVVLLGSWAAISLGWKPGGVRGGVGTFAAAYIATKLTQPLRIAATLALTPLAARAYERLRPSARARAAGGEAPARPAVESPRSAEPGE
ncbi:MAG: FAM210A/B-like domain-containing protein [Longimicrobiaceae bacterium]